MSYHPLNNQHINLIVKPIEFDIETKILDF